MFSFEETDLKILAPWKTVRDALYRAGVKKTSTYSYLRFWIRKNLVFGSPEKVSNRRYWGDVKINILGALSVLRERKKETKVFRAIVRELDRVEIYIGDEEVDTLKFLEALGIRIHLDIKDKLPREVFSKLKELKDVLEFKKKDGKWLRLVKPEGIHRVIEALGEHRESVVAMFYVDGEVGAIEDAFSRAIDFLSEYTGSRRKIPRAFVKWFSAPLKTLGLRIHRKSEGREKPREEMKSSPEGATEERKTEGKIEEEKEGVRGGEAGTTGREAGGTARQRGVGRNGASGKNIIVTSKGRKLGFFNRDAEAYNPEYNYRELVEEFRALAEDKEALDWVRRKVEEGFGWWDLFRSSDYKIPMKLEAVATVAPILDYFDEKGNLEFEGAYFLSLDDLLHPIGVKCKLEYIQRSLEKWKEELKELISEEEAGSQKIRFVAATSLSDEDKAEKIRQLEARISFGETVAMVLKELLKIYSKKTYWRIFGPPERWRNYDCSNYF